eukprot:TRINITY_DN1692_c0_g1_i1.p1 TRINITY_DN1692_c0_g1~~TRINITY_DN1692_c0_g1_i1.p1  ORF type:complete len:467 (-),score=60.88 TRINITY_DN1692_c0_g1_i1:305-1705(-)
MKKSMNNRFKSEQLSKRERKSGESEASEQEPEQPSLKKSKNTSGKRVPLGTIVHPNSNAAPIQLPKVIVSIPPLNPPKRVYKEKEKLKEKQKERNKEEKAEKVEGKDKDKGKHEGKGKEREHGKDTSRSQVAFFSPSTSNLDSMVLSTPPRSRREPNQFVLPFFLADYLKHLQTISSQYRPTRPVPLPSKKLCGTPKNRVIVLGWLSEVCEEYLLLRETFHIAANLIDRYLAKTPELGLEKYQLLATSAIFIAAKIEEEDPPNVFNFLGVSGDSYSKKDVLDMEKDILRKLDWFLWPVTSMTFLRFYTHVVFTSPFSFDKADSSTMKTPPRQLFKMLDNRSLSSPLSIFDLDGACFPQHDFVAIACLLDRVLLDSQSMRFDPSLLAVSGVVSFFPEHREVLSEISQHSPNEINECAEWMKRFESLPKARLLDAPLESLPNCFHLIQYAIGDDVVDELQKLVQVKAI